MTGKHKWKQSVAHRLIVCKRKYVQWKRTDWNRLKYDRKSE